MQQLSVDPALLEIAEKKTSMNYNACCHFYHCNSNIYLRTTHYSSL